MAISVAEAARQLESEGLLTRYRKDQTDKVIARIAEIVGQQLPAELVAFYRERIEFIGHSARAVVPIWKDWPGIGWYGTDSYISDWLPTRSIPIFGDGSGNHYAVDLSANGPLPQSTSSTLTNLGSPLLRLDPRLPLS